MARERNVGREDNSTTGSYPAGDGGRVRRIVRLNNEGINLAVDPDGSEGYIYSGMTKRMAIETGGRFCDLDNYRED